jgi:hypothetical protein
MNIRASDTQQDHFKVKYLPSSFLNTGPIPRNKGACLIADLQGPISNTALQKTTSRMH